MHSGPRPGGRLSGAGQPARGAGTAGAGRASVLRELYARYGGAVHGRCQYLLKDARRGGGRHAGRVRQGAHATWTRSAPEASPLTWLMKIATHHCLNLLRADRARWRAQFDATSGRARGAMAARRRWSPGTGCAGCSPQFDVETQAAAIHYHVDEMTLEEVAALLGRSVPTVASGWRSSPRGAERSELS